jgi:hypothetical protein
MSRRPLFVAASVVVAAITITIPANPQGMRQSRFGQYWGTFVHWVDFGHGPGQRYAGLVTMNVDGTFRAGNVHGVWEITGLRSANATGLLQILDASGNLIGLERHRCSLTYSHDFYSYQATEFAETVSCQTPLTCPDPLDPKTKWTPVTWAPYPWSASGARVEVVATPQK